MSKLLLRRDLLKSAARGFGAAGLGAALPKLSAASLTLAQETQDKLGKKIEFLSRDPRNGGPELKQLIKRGITPNEYFYVRSHAANPKLDAADFTFTVEGLVRKPLTLTLEDLKRLKQRETTATLTCAGNRRVEFNAEAKVGGVQWGSNAIGNAKWGGVQLADVIKLAGPLENARHVWFEGLDQIKRKDSLIPFGASIPIERAMDVRGSAGVLLATQMNGNTLPPDHGYPLRSVVPGYIGARSVKWLGKIIVSDRPSKNHYVENAYKIVKSTDRLDFAEAGPIYRFPINGAICDVRRVGENPRSLNVIGYALPSGRSGCKITKVEISADDGQTWTVARLKLAPAEFCWTLWEASVKTNARTRELVMRAFDSAGNFMPQRVAWNAKGYCQNSWFRTTLNF